eukprot:scaffold94892_cov35-Attheya_sp.AAC.4
MNGDGLPGLPNNYAIQNKKADKTIYCGMPFGDFKNKYFNELDWLKRMSNFVAPKDKAKDILLVGTEDSNSYQQYEIQQMFNRVSRVISNLLLEWQGFDTTTEVISTISEVPTNQVSSIPSSSSTIVPTQYEGAEVPSDQGSEVSSTPTNITIENEGHDHQLSSKITLKNNIGWSNSRPWCNPFMLSLLHSNWFVDTA